MATPGLHPNDSGTNKNNCSQKLNVTGSWMKKIYLSNRAVFQKKSEMKTLQHSAKEAKVVRNFGAGARGNSNLCAHYSIMLILTELN